MICLYRLDGVPAPPARVNRCLLARELAEIGFRHRPRLVHGLHGLPVDRRTIGNALLFALEHGLVLVGRRIRLVETPEEELREHTAAARTWQQ